MKHGDKLKLHIDNNIVQGVFQAWEGYDTICFKDARGEFLTHYKSVVEINGEEV